jgi:hypothetical protein
MKRKIPLLPAVAVLFFVTSIALAAVGTIQTWTGKGSRRSTVEFTIESPTVGTAAKFLPGTANANSLGSTTSYFKDVVSSRFGFGTTITVGTTLPDYVGQMGVTSTYELRIATAANANAWQKVGAQ